MKIRSSSIAESIQNLREEGDWYGAIREMEKLFALKGDPHIRIRIGDARRKLNNYDDAVREYIRAGDLFVSEGFIAKALAQYSLALRLDSSNNYARQQKELVRRLFVAKKEKRRSRIRESRCPILPERPA